MRKNIKWLVSLFLIKRKLPYINIYFTVAIQLYEYGLAKKTLLFLYIKHDVKVGGLLLWMGDAVVKGTVKIISNDFKF